MRQPTKQALVPVFFAITVLDGLVAWPFAVRFGEPYPWLLSPHFSSVPTQLNGTVTIEEPTISLHFTDGGVESVSPVQLFGPISRSNAGKLATRMRHQSHVDVASGSFPRNFRYLPLRYLPGLRRASRTPSGVSVPADVAQYLRQRAQSLFPTRSAKLLRVQWNRVTRTANSTPLKMELVDDWTASL